MSSYVVAECVYGGAQEREVALYSSHIIKEHQSSSFNENRQNHHQHAALTTDHFTNAIHNAALEFSERTNACDNNISNIINNNSNNNSNHNHSNNSSSNHNTGNDNNITNNNHVGRAKCGRPVFNKTLDLVFKYGERNHFGARSAECICGKVYGMARSRRLQSHAEVCLAIPPATRQLIMQTAPKDKQDKEQKQRQTSRKVSHANNSSSNSNNNSNTISNKELSIKRPSIEQDDRGAPIIKKYKDDIFNPVNDALARGIALGGLPIAMLDNIMIKKSYLLLGHTLPDKKSLTELIVPRITSEIENAMRRELRESPPRSLSIEFDCWKDQFNATLMAVTASLPDGKIYLLKLKDDSVIKASTADILEFLTQTICEFIPYTKINAIVSKLSSTCLEVRQKFIDLPGCEAIIGSRCLAHILTLIGYHASNISYLKMRIQEAENILGYLTNYLSANKKAKDRANHNLTEDVATRWYYIGLKINNIFKNKRILENRALDDTLQGQIMHPEIKKSILDTQFWADLEAARVFYEPLCKAIDIAESNGSTISSTFSELLSFARLCFETINNDFRNIFLESLVKNFSNLDADLVLACYVLDPRYKSKYLTPTAKLMATKKVISIGHSMNFNDADTLAMFDDYDHYENRTGYYSAYKYSDKNPFEWWRRCPSKTKLKDIACRLSLLRSSSTNIEYLYALLSQSGHRSKVDIASVEDSLRIRLNECKNDLGEDYLSNSCIAHQEMMNCYERQVSSRQYFEGLLDVKNMDIEDLMKSPDYVYFEKLVEFKAVTAAVDEADGSNYSFSQQERSSVEDLMEIYKRRFT